MAVSGMGTLRQGGAGAVHLTVAMAGREREHHRACMPAVLGPAASPRVQRDAPIPEAGTRPPVFDVRMFRRGDASRAHVSIVVGGGVSRHQEASGSPVAGTTEGTQMPAAKSIAARNRAHVIHGEAMRARHWEDGVIDPFERAEETQYNRDRRRFADAMEAGEQVRAVVGRSTDPEYLAEKFATYRFYADQLGPEAA